MRLIYSILFTLSVSYHLFPLVGRIIFFHAVLFVMRHVDSFVMNSMLTFFCVDLNRIAEHDMRLMAIDADTLGIPETEYEPHLTMASNKFTRIASEGAAANGNVLVLQAEEEAERSTSEKNEKKEVKEKCDDVEMVDGDEDKEDDAEFKSESDHDEGEEEKADEPNEDEDEYEEGRVRKRQRLVKLLRFGSRSLPL